MKQLLHVTIKHIEEDYLVCELPDSQTLRWPLEESTNEYTVGDTLVLTLTHSTEVLQELLASED